MLSVVIATLGGGSLRETIELLNRGTLVPDEILIAIPQAEAPRVADLGIANVRVVVTDCRGQVAQRICGFQQARHPLVVQLDDDIAVRPDCLRRLADFALAHPDASVAPKLFNRATGRYHAFLVPRQPTPSWADRLMFWILNGARGFEPGQISRAGVNMGVPEFPDDWFDLGWLAGACVMHHREHLVLTPFYPFSGKAFAEDLFHTRELRRKAVRLHRCGAAVIDVDMSSSGIGSVRGFLRDYREYSRRMTAFLRGSGGSVGRLHLFLVFNLLRLALGKVAGRRPSRRD